MMRSLHSQKTAFTLIELSIVLVIIGLIVGGVLVGQDLIKAAQIRAQMSEVEKLNTAVSTFRLKYNCLPGDCGNATTFFTGGSQPEQVSNGDGNKRICGYYNATGGCNGAAHDSYGWDVTSAGESHRGWDHLAASGLVELAQYDETDRDIWLPPGVGYPKLKINSVGEGSDAAGHTYRQGAMTFGYEPAAGYHPGGHRIPRGWLKRALDWFEARLKSG